MTTKILALTDALGNLVRFVVLPGQRFDTVGVAPLIEGVEFDALIADKAFDSDAIIARTERALSQDRHLPTSAPDKAGPHRQGDVQMAPLDREPLRQPQGVQTHRHARRQNRSELLGHDPSRRRRDKLPMNPNRP
jgi:hypothetical protein